MSDNGSVKDKEGEGRGRKFLTCLKHGEEVEASDELSCLHPKEVCKFRLTCPIYQIGKNR